MEERESHLLLLLFTIATLLPFSLYCEGPRPSLDLISRRCRHQRMDNASVYYKTFTDMLDKLGEEMESEKFAMETGGNGSNKLYVMSQCMDYLTRHECNECFTQSATYLSSCFNSTGGRVYLDGCFIRAENYEFFGEATGAEDNVSCRDTPPAGSNYTLIAMNVTNGLANEAPENENFALKRDTSSEQQVHGMAICWKTLNKKNCKLCLKQAAQRSQTCLPLKEGIALYTGCVIRYANYKFADDKIHQQSPEPMYMISALCISLIMTAMVIIGFCVRVQGQTKSQKKSKETEVKLLYKVTKFKYSTIEKATECFNKARKLGQGGYGEVFKGTLQDGREIAVKRLITSSSLGKDDTYSEMDNEMDIINKAQHRNLVRFLGCCFTTRDRFLIYEFLANKSLDLILFDSEKKKELDWKKRFRIIIGTAEGLKYLHEDCQVRIIHRDIKSSNILLDLKYRPKISDFGLARFYSSDISFTSTGIAGTLGYMAPEYLAQGRLTEKVDVYSFGVLILEIISGERSNKTRSDDTFETIITRTWRLFQANSLEKIVDKSLEKDCIEEIRRVAQVGLLCVQESPSFRPTMKTVVSMLRKEDVQLPTPTKPPFTDEHLEFAASTSRKNSDAPIIWHDY